MRKKRDKHILVDEETHKAVKILAAEADITLGEVITKLVEGRKDD